MKTSQRSIALFAAVQTVLVWCTAMKIISSPTRSAIIMHLAFALIATAGWYTSWRGCWNKAVDHQEREEKRRARK